MLYDLVKNLINITEGFPSRHMVISSLENQKGTPYNNKIKVRPRHLNTMSPGHLFRGKGLNITSYKKVMKKAGIVTDNPDRDK